MLNHKGSTVLQLEIIQRVGYHGDSWALLRHYRFESVSGGQTVFFVLVTPVTLTPYDYPLW